MKHFKFITWVLFGFLCMFQILDAIQTNMILESGIAGEANPIVDFFIQKMGFWNAMLFTKGLVMGFLAIVVYKCQINLIKGKQL